jgi:hypothetical protein
MSKRPPIVYHGSPYLFDQAVPSFPTPTTDPVCRRAVYASDDRRIALAFAFGLRSAEPGTFRRPRWWRKQNEVFLAVTDDVIDWNAPGFLYHLPPATFSSDNGWEWLSTTKVTPIHREAIYAGSVLSFVSRLNDEAIYEVHQHFHASAA